MERGYERPNLIGNMMFGPVLIWTNFDVNKRLRQSLFWLSARSRTVAADFRSTMLAAIQIHWSH
jgi:hypothetical protein